MAAILPVILCGGSGTRLWPLSRQHHAKPFLRLFGQHSLLQETLLRIAPIENALPPIIVCSQSSRFMVEDHLQEIGMEVSAILIEPEARNTAPAIAVATAWAEKFAQPAILLVTPADHRIVHPEIFRAAVVDACAIAETSALVTFGVSPTEASPHFGYIKTSGTKVERFVEKPKTEIAQEMLTEGSWYWNSGMFCMSVTSAISAFDQHAPLTYHAANQSLSQATHYGKQLLLGKSFTQARAMSFDHAIMEHHTHVAMVPLQAGWADVGTWGSVWQQQAKDSQGNSISGDVLATRTENCLIHGSKRLVALAGVQDLVVIDTDDALFIANINDADHAREYAQQLASENRQQALQHSNEQRPWGDFEAIDVGEHFKVKRIRVRSGGKLSLQRHQHRAEHWVVVSGSARVTCGDTISDLEANQSSYIPMNTTHRLENIGDAPLEIIEIQTGQICDESDIIRLADDYVRAASKSG